MTREQTQDFLAMIQGTYPNFNPPNKTVAVNAWKMALEDYEEEQVHLAFKEYIVTENTGFAPSPGQILNMVKKQEERKYFAELEKMLLERSYGGQIEQKRQQMIESANERKRGEIKALEDKREGVLPPKEKLEKVRRRLEEM